MEGVASGEDPDSLILRHSEQRGVSCHDEVRLRGEGSSNDDIVVGVGHNARRGNRLHRDCVLSISPDETIDRLPSLGDSPFKLWPGKNEPKLGK
jgi:hypothetical protein